MGDLNLSLGKQVRIGRVGILAVVVVLERLEGRVLLVGVPGREVVRILGSVSRRVGCSAIERVPSCPRTFAALWPFNPASASASNLVGASSLYGPAAWSFSVETSGSLTVSVSTAEGAIFSVSLLLILRTGSVLGWPAASLFGCCFSGGCTVQLTHPRFRSSNPFFYNPPSRHLTPRSDLRGRALAIGKHHGSDCATSICSNQA